RAGGTRKVPAAPGGARPGHLVGWAIASFPKKSGLTEGADLMTVLRVLACGVCVLLSPVGARGEIGALPDGRDPAEGALWDAEAKFRDPKVSRKQPPADFEAVARAHPVSRYGERVRKSVAVLKKMVKEDEALARKR